MHFYILCDCFKLKDLKKILSQHTVVVPIFLLSDALQEEIMHWVFRNEDR